MLRYSAEIFNGLEENFLKDLKELEGRGRSIDVQLATGAVSLKLAAQRNPLAYEFRGHLT